MRLSVHGHRTPRNAILPNCSSFILAQIYQSTQRRGSLPEPPTHDQTSVSFAFLCPAPVCQYVINTTWSTTASAPTADFLQQIHAINQCNKSQHAGGDVISTRLSSLDYTQNHWVRHILSRGSMSVSGLADKPRPFSPAFFLACFRDAISVVLMDLRCLVFSIPGRISVPWLY